KEEKETIKALYERGIKNGVEGLEIIPPARVKLLEPNVADTVEGALLAKTAAVVSPWELCLALAETAVQNDCILKLDTEVQSITKLDAKGFAIKTDKGELKAKYVFNAAGNHSDDIHNMVAKPSFEILPSRGEYFLLDKCEGTRVNHVLFQCPGRLGKGVLVAPTVHGNLIVGPSSDEASKDDVANTSESLNTVRQRALRSVPSINFGQNIRNFSGVRANSTNDDFIIGEADDVNGFFDLAGIRSPGLTAAVAIGELCVDFLKNKGETLNLKENIVDTRKRISFNSLNAEEKNILIKKTPSYGRVICRCENITEGEILACLKTPIPPVSVDGVKRRVGTGM
ncbi:MAG: FAD-dependent oxidoreductase, partial [Oscillospiraceae bacterium]